jgi:CRP/FNR family cyclic AMP-dependent transcriptional regulator
VGAKLAAKIRQLTYQRSLLGLPNIGQRVCCQLWMLIKNGREAEAAKATKALIENPPTHMEIAIMLNVSRETVTRVFQSLQNQQIVRRDGSTRLEVKDLPALRRLANGEETL